ncbi:MAG: TetR/AcrR family transcriptional regulator [Deltaproteobacteria bacterium]|nr:TetR/AcrR family transcriptional regulator [Deltaproteobacteria bacterium]
MGIIERRKREKDLRRELAMDAAMAIYKEEGYHAITMEKIAERCEVSRASLYLYFKNKDEILINAIVDQTEYFTDLLQDLYENRERLKDNLLKELWLRFIDFYENEPETFNASLYFQNSEMIFNLPEDLRKSINESGSKVVSLQHKIIEYGVKSGLFIECNPMTLSEVIWTSFLGIIQLEKSKQVLSRKGHYKATRDLALEVLSRGVVKK